MEFNITNENLQVIVMYSILSVIYWIMYKNVESLCVYCPCEIFILALLAIYIISYLGKIVSFTLLVLLMIYKIYLKN